MKIRFIYFKGGKDSLIGKGIVSWTWLLALVRFDFKSLKHNFSHVELWLPDEDGIFIMNNIGAHLVGSQYCGQCFSSTTRGDSKGVRFAPAPEVLKHPDRWVYQEYEVEEEDVEDVMEVYSSMVGWKYDFAGVFGFFIPFPLQDPEKYYCSELCAQIAYLLKLTKWHKRISPRRLAKVLGGQIKELK